MLIFNICPFFVTGVDADVQLCELESLEINQPELMTGMHKLKLAESEYSIGYETMMPDSDKGSVVSCHSISVFRRCAIIPQIVIVSIQIPELPAAQFSNFQIAFLFIL